MYGHEVNNYKYLCIEVNKNPYGIEKRFLEEFQKMGFYIIDNSFYEQLSDNEKDITLFADYDYFINYNGPSTLNLVLTNSDGTTIWSAGGQGNTFLSAKGDMKSAQKQIIQQFSRLKYKYNATLASQNVKKSINSNGNYLKNDNSESSKSSINESLMIKPEEIISDVDINIPINSKINEKTFALIIANEDYNKVNSVPYAKRDGNKLKEYLINTLGINTSHIYLLENATLNDMRYELSRLSKISEAYKGDCSFIIYYSGHGIPDEKENNSYLLPVDGYGNDVSSALPLVDLYEQLGSIQSNKTILIMDACFSGASREGNMLVSARGVALKAKPIVATGKLITISACQEDETAYPFNEKGHGLLTYYLLKKLQESKGNANIEEITDYLVDQVGKTAIVINGKTQTPLISVSPDFQNTWKTLTLRD